MLPRSFDEGAPDPGNLLGTQHQGKAVGHTAHTGDVTDTVAVSNQETEVVTQRWGAEVMRPPVPGLSDQCLF